MAQDPIVIVSVARTPMGGFQGSLSGFTASELGAHAIQQAVLRSGHPTLSEHVDEVIMGCVLPAGQGQAPARQAALGAGLPLGTACTTINKMCGSGMKAIMQAHDALAAGSSQIVVAGGMESMSNAPYLLPKARGGMRMGHGQVLDHMFLDGLEDAYDQGRLMGTFAEECADQYQFSRAAQDEFAVRSLQRAREATENGHFAWEIAPITVRSRKGEETMAHDEQALKADPAKVTTLKPAFRKPDGTVTAANSSSISDGAAALVLTTASRAQALGLRPLAKILGHSTHAQQPSLFTTAPVGALHKLFAKTGLSAGQVDLFEINEAFAVVTMAAMVELNLPANKVNIHGGACALGHPIGASGARIVCTLLGALSRTGGKIGVASLCIGGGEATALALEML
ncbi:MAG TPA: acetyl-CoA C-acyltransferase [Limnobacter sp.]|nr:acetyl-CoA C-acyltransferase [Limnobacter sp.]